MRKVYETEGLSVFDIDIASYPCRVLKFSSGNVTIQVPMGQGEDKIMFDELVYRNKRTYSGTDTESVIKNVNDFITNYKAKLTHN